MKFIIFLISAYVLGFLSAVPAGPVQIEVIRRSINGHLRSSLMVIIGAFAADVAYGAIAFFGIAPFLSEEKTKAIFLLGGAVILVFLGIMIIRQSLADGPVDYNSRYLRKKRWGLVSGFSLSAANPAMILWWLIAAKLFIDIRLINDMNANTAVSFLTAGGFGFVTYLSLVSVFLYWAKRFISDSKIRRINLACGILLLFIAAYFMYSSYSGFSHLQ